MTIGFDLDGIFINLPPFLPQWVIDALYRDRDQKKLHYRIPGAFEKRIREASHNHFFRPPIKKNIFYIQEKAKEKKDTYFLVSSRFGFLEDATKRILKRYGLDSIFRGCYFNYDNEQPHIFKDKIIKKLGITKFIDDDIYLLTFLAKKNKKTVFFWFNPDRNDKISENLFAITDLKQIT